MPCPGCYRQTLQKQGRVCPQKSRQHLLHKIRWARKGADTIGAKKQPNYDATTRERAIREVVDKNRTVMAVAEEMDIYHTTIYRWLARYQDQGAAAFSPKPVGKPKKPFDYKEAYETVMRFKAFLAKSKGD